MPFNNPQEKPSVDWHSEAVNNRYGPQNARRQVMLRGPVDRITHSAKEQGLHSFLEFSAGQNFEVRLNILNPQASDLGLIALWEKEIDSGFLRLGAITSAGRGRLSILQDKSVREIYALPGKPFEGLILRKDDHNVTDVMTGLWHKCHIPWDEQSRKLYLERLEKSLKNME